MEIDGGVGGGRDGAVGIYVILQSCKQYDVIDFSMKE